MLTKERLWQMEEPELRQFLPDLLRAMGFQDVEFYHGGAGEQGKDIVCWEKDKFGTRTNIAFVIKAKDITGTLSVANEVAGQVRQCFGDPYIDKVTGERHDIRFCCK